jgi:hypothetical protein
MCSWFRIFAPILVTFVFVSGSAAAHPCDALIDRFNQLNSEFARIFNAEPDGDLEYLCNPAFGENARKMNEITGKKAAVARKLESSCRGRYVPSKGTSSRQLTQAIKTMSEQAANIEVSCKKLRAMGVLDGQGRSTQAKSKSPEGQTAASGDSNRPNCSDISGLGNSAGPCERPQPTPPTSTPVYTEGTRTEPARSNDEVARSQALASGVIDALGDVRSGKISDPTAPQQLREVPPPPAVEAKEVAVAPSNTCTLTKKQAPNRLCIGSGDRCRCVYARNGCPYPVTVWYKRSNAKELSFTLDPFASTDKTCATKDGTQLVWITRWRPWKGFPKKGDPEPLEEVAAE